MALHTCMLCEAVCGLQVETTEGRVISVRGDPDDPFSRGHICPKAAALGDLSADPDRVREPLRRTGDRWLPISWEEAIDEASTRLSDIQKRDGRDAVGLYVGNPTAHSYTAILALPFFSKLLGSRQRFSATSVDQLPHMLASLEMFGHQLALPVPDLDRTKFLLVLGANPLVSNGSLMTAGHVRARLQSIRARGGRIVVIDPRRTETAAIADRHLFIRPGGDACLLAGMLHVIFAEALGNPGRLAGFTDGFIELARLMERFTPARVATRAGIPADEIRALAREFARTAPAVAYGRVGLCTQEFGGLAAWLVLALNTVTGNLDREGGAMFPLPAADLVGLATLLGERGHFGAWTSRVRGLPEFGGELPAAALAEEIETPGEGRIRALVTHAGNPVLSTPGGARLSRALASLEFMVSIDVYRNETTRHAHLILPTPLGLERDHYDLVFYALAVRNAARYAAPLLPSPPGVREDWRILFDLSLALHARGGGRRKHSLAWMIRGMRHLGPRRALDLALRAGPHRLTLERLRQTPHGIDLGPHVSRLPALLRGAHRRIVLAPPRLAADLARLEARLAVDEPDGLRLIGRRLLRSNNSWMHNTARLVKGRDSCTLLMHPADAGARGLTAGQSVLVRSRAGEIQVPLEISDEVAPGVVSLPHGFGHAHEGIALDIARAHAGASVNDVTDPALLDVLSGTASLNGVAVDVRSASEGKAG